MLVAGALLRATRAGLASWVGDVRAEAGLAEAPDFTTLLHWSTALLTGARAHADLLPWRRANALPRRP